MNHWDGRLFTPKEHNAPLSAQIQQLFAQQRSTWELFRNGEAALGHSTTKIFSHNGHTVIVQANPGRSISTNAKVDAVSIAKRPCFLCPDSLPPEERGIAFSKFVILPNPFPILPDHVTIALNEHKPQNIKERINDFLKITRALGPDMFVLYNGPQCGASAPDHMHFQACNSRGVPLFSQWVINSDDSTMVPLTIWDLQCLACTCSSAAQAEASLKAILSSLQTVIGSSEEPMLNILALYRNNKFLIAIFPRAKHRSACYFAPPEDRLSISPAAVEMAGIIVVADNTHFDRVNEDAILSMFREVTLERHHFTRLTEVVYEQ